MPNVCGRARHVAALPLFGWQPHHISSAPDIHIYNIYIYVYIWQKSGFLQTGNLGGAPDP